MKFKAAVILLLLTSYFTLSAQDISTSKFGNGILNIIDKDSTWSMKIGARMQFLGLATWENTNGNLHTDQTNFLLRRSRLKFDGFAFTPKLTYKIELGLSNRDMSGASIYTSNTPRFVYDAVMKWNFHENFVLWFGQTKLPGNRERVISSGDMQFVDRSILNANFNIDRDVGIQLRHHFNLSNSFVVREIIAISQGEGRNVTTGNLGGFQYTGRVEVLPFGTFQSKGDYVGSSIERPEKSKLSVGLTYDFNNDAVKTRSNLGKYMLTSTGFHKTNITTLFIDAMYKYKGFSFMGEYAKRDADKPIATEEDGTPTGDIVHVGQALNLQAGYLFANNWELSGRYSNVNPEENITGTQPINQYTLGVSKYIVGHKLKVQTDISYTDIQQLNNSVTYRLQFDVHF